MVTCSFHLHLRSSQSFHCVFHFFHELLSSINWAASSVWVFIAQLVEHCRANAEAMGSNLVETPNNFFFPATAIVPCSAICISAVHNSFHCELQLCNNIFCMLSWDAFLIVLQFDCSVETEAIQFVLVFKEMSKSQTIKKLLKCQ